MKFDVVKGDLIQLAEQGMFDIVLHGCNCFHTMGGGIAGQIVRKYPEVLESDKRVTSYGDRMKLGTWHFAHEVKHTDGHSWFIINAYTQYRYGKGNGLIDPDELVDYNAVYRVFSTLGKFLEQLAADKAIFNMRVGFPKIGAGLAGGDWDTIKYLIEPALPYNGRVQWTLVDYK